MAISTCRSCQAPLVWQDTDQGRRPFNPDGTPHRDARGSSPRGASSPSRDREIRRMACLKAAADFCGHKSTMVENVGTAEVLRVAEAFEAWVLKGGDADR